MSDPELTGDDLLRALATLANPHRLRVVASLAGGRNYVSELARELGISRALLQVHLRKLEAAGLVRAQLELSEDGKAMKFYEVLPFAFDLSPAQIARLAPTVTTPEAGRPELRRTTDNGPPGPADADDIDPTSDKGATP